MNYRLSPAARADLRSIWTYTEETWGKVQADRYILSIETACEELALGQTKGRPAAHFRTGYMMTAVGSHFVFFKRSKQGSIDVIRVLHQKMDLRARLFDRN